MRRVFRVPFTARAGRDVDDELAFHLDMRVRRLVDAGWSPEAAREEALRQFGDVTDLLETQGQRQCFTRQARWRTSAVPALA